jgi:hypothetical protein
LGFVPNALKLYAYRPEIAGAVWKLSSIIMRDASSALDPLLKRKLSAVCGCAYCTAHNCAELKNLGLSEEGLQDIITNAYEPKNEMERVCFDYVRSASEDATSVLEEILQRLRQYLTPPQIIELARRQGTPMPMRHKRNTGPMLSSARCGAKTRAGVPCRSPSVYGKRRCRMHGGAAGSGAPRGNKNALKHGRYTREAIAERKHVSELVRQARQLILQIK